MLVVGGTVSIARFLAFYSVTFAVAVIGGLWFICRFLCLIYISPVSVQLTIVEHSQVDNWGYWCENTSTVLKLLTCSSALWLIWKSEFLWTPLDFALLTSPPSCYEEWQLYSVLYLLLQCSVGLLWRMVNKRAVAALGWDWDGCISM